MKVSAQPKRKSIAQVLKGANRDMAALLSVAHEQGYRVVLTNNCHFRVTAPRRKWRNCRETIGFFPKTPSDYSSIGNSKAKLRRMGVRFS
jgi:hypothetical protein